MSILGLICVVLALVATLPGAVILMADRRGRNSASKLTAAQVERVGGTVHV